MGIHIHHVYAEPEKIDSVNTAPQNVNNNAQPPATQAQQEAQKNAVADNTSASVHQTNAQFLADKLTNPITTQQQTKKSPASNNNQLPSIKIKWDNEDLLDIIHRFTALKGVNIQLPQGANAIANKVTLTIEEKITLDEAWKLLYTLLDDAGYTMEPKGDMYVIKKNSPDITREPLPLYIGTPPVDLPNTDQRIRYIYYLSNIKLVDDPSSEVPTILTQLLPLNTSAFKVDTTTNGLIITAKANDIRAAMRIVIDLDKTDFHETLEVVNLHHTNAKTIADLFNEKILKTGSDINKYHLSAKQQTEITFFSKQTRLINEDRTNTLFILGKTQATERVKDFILKYLDVELESGKSILHIHQLQYSRAEDLAGVLNSIITSAAQGGSGQSSVGGVTSSGAFRTFGEVIIKADAPSGDTGAAYYGGNKLVVAARNADWEVIKKLIEQLDKPQPQVLLEILIVDISTDDSRILGTMLRDPLKIPLPGTSQFQAINIGNTGASGITPTDPTILTTPQTAPIPPTSSLQADLLSEYYSVGGAPSSLAPILSNTDYNGTPVGGAPGSTLISMNDSNGATWGLLQILQTLGNTKVLSHPHVITTSNQPATVEVGQQLLLFDEAVGSGGTTTTIKNKPINADLTVVITPRISSANTVHLQISVNITNFIDPTSPTPTRTSRIVKTNALVKDKDVLAVGGLINVNTTQGVSETPILSKIPILGYLFKSRNNEIIEENLTVFISPTIIQPRLMKGVSEHTQDYVQIAKNYCNEGSLFDSLQDPITRWFFKTDIDAPNAMDEFVARDETLTELKKKNRRLNRKEGKKSKQKVTSVAQNKQPEDNPVKQLKELQALIAHDENPLLSA